VSFGFTAARLRGAEAALAEWQAAGATWADRQAATEAERDAALAEVARLRAVLHAIVAGHGWPRVLAEDALGGGT